MSSDKVIEEWFVCFEDAEPKHWLQRFMKPGFKHVMAFKYSPGGKFLIVVEPLFSHTSIDLIEATPENVAIMKLGCKVVTVITEHELSFDRGGICRFNCVEVVKSLLGIKSFFTFTPYQLYRRLTDG